MEEKEKKKSKGKLIIAIVLIAATVIIAGFYLGIFSLPTGLAAAQTSTTGNPTAPSTPQPQPTYTVTGTLITEKNVTETLPYYEPLDLESGRYMIYVTADKPVWIRLYDEVHFNEWKNAGTHGQLVAGTNCCLEKDKTQNLEQRFDVSIGYGGKHYLLFLDGSENLTSISFKITQILKF